MLQTPTSFTTIDPPGSTSAFISDANDNGEVVGHYTDAHGVIHGFAGTPGHLTTIDVPGATATTPVGINNVGEIVGEYTDAHGVTHGFLDEAGSITTIDPPGSVLTDLTDINDAGQIVGYYSPSPDLTNPTGFLYAEGGFSLISPPGATDSLAYAINSAGEIIGSYLTADGVQHGFLDTAGDITTIDWPGSLVTALEDINDSGQIIGQSLNASGEHNRFIEADGTLTSVPGPSGQTDWGPDGINNAGESFGNGFDAVDHTHGFVEEAGVVIPIDVPVPGARFGTSTEVRAIDNSGDVFGNYIDASGQMHGFEGAVAACYAAGTRILTSRGEVAVEELRVGDQARTLLRQDFASVIWMGYRQFALRRHPRAQDVQPVRVCAGAFGPGIPRRDLRLSPDHAVFRDGVLIPIRHLINDATIVQERVDDVTYWHIELAAHNILLADGLPAESYLDTGNRSAFANGGDVAMAHPDFALRLRNAKTCALFVSDDAGLAAARCALLAQALSLGHAITTDADLQVFANKQPLYAERSGRVHCYRLPPTARTVRITSRVAVPEHMRPDSDDYRCLGVAVSRIIANGYPIALTDKRLISGWHEAEAGWRWTTGDAVLAIAGVRTLEIEIAMTMCYWLPQGVQPCCGVA